MDPDPPRRPPARPDGLFRSKSYHGPIRRKRGREVLEDITYIVNEARNWQPLLQAPSGPTPSTSSRYPDGELFGLGIAPPSEPDGGPSSDDLQHHLEARADGQDAPPVADHSTPSSDLNEEEQIGRPARRRLQRDQLARGPPGLQPSRTLPRIIAGTDHSSSPPSSPMHSHFHDRGLGVSGPRSPSLRAPPTLSRRSSSSSLLTENGIGLRRTRTHSGVRTLTPSPTFALLSRFEGTRLESQDGAEGQDGGNSEGDGTHPPAKRTRHVPDH